MQCCRNALSEADAPFICRYSRFQCYPGRRRFSLESEYVFQVVWDLLCGSGGCNIASASRPACLVIVMLALLQLLEEALQTQELDDVLLHNITVSHCICRLRYFIGWSHVAVRLMVVNFMVHQPRLTLLLTCNAQVQLNK